MTPESTSAASRSHLRLGVLISGSGTTLQNLIDRIADGRLPGMNIELVISSRPDVEGVARARRVDLPVQIARPRDFPDVQSFSRRVSELLDEHQIDLAVQAGWLCYWRLPDRWIGRVINIHPSLLPDFGGKGFYGIHVHEAVLAARRAESGATVHFVDNEYDHGQIILQRHCPVLATDTPASLAARVGELERELFPDVIKRFQSGAIRLPGRR